MKQVKSYADSRLLNSCIYCGGPANTREHVPSKIFLDKPYPENLPIVEACLKCNNGFSADEEYVATFFEVVCSGTTDINKIKRERIVRILERTPLLKSRIQNAIVTNSTTTTFNMEIDRVRRIIIKLAQGHVAFELSEHCRNIFPSVWWGDISTMTRDKKDDFLSDTIIGSVSEIGSRHSRKIMIVESSIENLNDGSIKQISIALNSWIEVQKNRYEYITDVIDDYIRVKMLIGGYFACEVVWSAMR
ncbi:hypothetical protein AADQ46_001001 [Enterobacter soli]